jgi:two-component system response regulator AtoC
MAHVFDLVDKVADHKTTVLITGESGTGKELIAKAIHNSGVRASGPMVSINCGGIPETLLESELFGYKKGAFTDAVKDKMGRFEEADGGTLFLDEIGELSLSFQVKLLRVLQEEEITPLGGLGSKKTDVRVIAATSKDLQKEVEAGKFREDLFYRIKVMTIHLPPLRERRGDIPLLIGYFIDTFNKKLKKNIEGLSSGAMPILMGYAWPGNIRELENLVERAILLAKSNLITPSELPSSLISNQDFSESVDPDHTLSLKKAFSHLEHNLIRKVLKLTGGNRSKAAKILEVSRPMLISKIKKYSLG